MLNHVITPAWLLGFEKKKVKDSEPCYEEEKD
jgi:hypothetical protein